MTKTESLYSQQFYFYPWQISVMRGILQLQLGFVVLGQPRQHAVEYVVVPFLRHLRKCIKNMCTSGRNYTQKYSFHVCRGNDQWMMYSSYSSYGKSSMELLISLLINALPNNRREQSLLPLNTVLANSTRFENTTCVLTWWTILDFSSRYCSICAPSMTPWALK